VATNDVYTKTLKKELMGNVPPMNNMGKGYTKSFKQSVRSLPEVQGDDRQGKKLCEKERQGNGHTDKRKRSTRETMAPCGTALKEEQLD